MTKTALITGCGSGIGLETARAFLAADWRVWATADSDAEDALAELVEEGCETLLLDVTDEEEGERVVDAVLEDAGQIDCLVNAESVARLGPMEDVTDDALDEQFDVNLYGPHRLARAVLPHMREREEGTIVNVSSVFGPLATPGSGAYAASKAALETASDAIRVEVEDLGIDVVVVLPPIVASTVSDDALASLDEADRTPEYGWIYDLYGDAGVLASDGVLSVDPRTVGEAILESAEAEDPEPRVAVGRLAKTAVLARHLPRQWRDRAFKLLRKLA